MFDHFVGLALKGLKDNISYPSFKFYKGICCCGESYVSETNAIVETRWSEHNMPCDESNPSKLLNESIAHMFSWKVICNAPKRKLASKILEAYFLATMKPTLKDQIESDLCYLFRYSIIFSFSFIKSF